MDRKGILFVLSGPSGAGKGTVLKQVLNRVNNIAVSVSATTRAPRPGEIDGVHYFFRTDEEFDKMVQNDEFLEHISKFNNRYGTPKAQVEKLLREGNDVVLEIETMGAKSIRKSMPKAVLIFVTPSDYIELSNRLNERNTETPEARALRLETARIEYQSIKYYDYIAINDNLDVCIETIVAIIEAERCKCNRNKELIGKFIIPKA